MSTEKINDGFVKNGASGVTQEEVRKVVDNAEEIKKKAEGPLAKYLEVITLLIAMVKDYFTGGYREIPWFTVAAATFGLLYILTPLDLVTDLIPLVGLLDDALVLGICVRMVEEDLEKYKAWKNIVAEQA